MLSSCNEPPVNSLNTSTQSIDKTMLLLDYFEQNGNYINSDDIPSIADASVIYALQNNNILIIDLRPANQYHEGHIAHAVNIQPDEVLDYFMYKIDPVSFEMIFFTCNTGNASGHVTAILRLLGYDNVYAMRFGLSGWDLHIAEKYWLANVSSHLEGKMDIRSYPKNPAGSYPAISAEAETAYAILIEQAKEALKLKVAVYTISLSDFERNPDDFYTICYWPLEKYETNGHLPGAIQYDPKVSLLHDSYLNTLPIDKTIVVYCYSGQHSAFVAAYLHLLGYDARSLAYGANGFIHETMARTEARPSRTFTKDLIQGFPLVESGMEVQEFDSEENEIEIITIQGGC